MDLNEQILYQINKLTDDEKMKVISFIELIKKNKIEIDSLMDRIIEENLEALRELAK